MHDYSETFITLRVPIPISQHLEEDEELVPIKAAFRRAQAINEVARENGIQCDVIGVEFR